MNPKLEMIFKRRSVRSYETRDVGDAMVKDLIEAGMAAPSAVAKDPWSVIVIRDKARLESLSEGLPNGLMLAQAAVGLVVVGDPAKAHDHLLSYLLQDCSAMIENMLLAASMLGLGACWLGVHPREERMAHLRKVLGIPGSMLPVAVLAVGWPASHPPARTRFASEKVHFEQW